MANILITGATGYVGNRLLELLSHRKHNLYCTARNKKRLELQTIHPSHLLEVDFLKTETLQKIPKQIDVAYFLMHSMSSGNKDFDDLETKVAQNFVDALKKTEVKQVIYLTGMINEKELSQHLSSRKKVEEILATGAFHLTTLRAGIIIGSGSASFEIIRDLVEKLPIMVAPRWIKTRCQPIAIRDVLNLLEKVILNTDTFDKNYDIAGPDILTYKEMLLTFAKCRKLKRHIFTVPVLTPRLSSYWLYFVTSVSYPLAKALVDSMSIDFIARDHSLIEKLNLHPVDYVTSIQLAINNNTHKF